MSVPDSIPDIARVLEAHSGERHIIVLQDFPDPDAISSAFAHQQISAQFNIQTDIVYDGKISHQENIALVRLLRIDLLHFSTLSDLKPYAGSVFVDNQGTTSDVIVQALEAAAVPTLVIVDHHERQNRLESEFCDIRPTGAAATIYTEYIRQGLVDMQRSRQEHKMLATALMHGIMTDTNGFLQAGAEDFQAVAFLSQYRPQAADFLLTEENIHTAIVYGIVKTDSQGETLVGSLRTSKITLDPDAFLKDALGVDNGGHHFGGGKTLAGGFEVPLGFLSDENNEAYEDLKWQVYDMQVKQKLFAKIGIQPD
jgi:nanoRNase/pAp phosphatase (c-di-AMP/oligoRNAs hydrolase)